MAEELTARLQGHPEIIGLFPRELMTYDRHYASLIRCPEYARVLIEAWKIERNDLVLSFHSQDTPLYAAMEKALPAIGDSVADAAGGPADGSAGIVQRRRTFSAYAAGLWRPGGQCRQFCGGGRDRSRPALCMS